MITIQWDEYKNRILVEIDNRAFFIDAFNIKEEDIIGDEARGTCPFAKDKHENGLDKNPSMSVNFSKGTYYCPVCHSKGNVHTYMKDIEHLSSDQAWFKLGDALGIDRPEGSEPLRPDLDQGLAGSYHRALMALKEDNPIRKMLRQKRGFTDETLRHNQIGWDGERVTIPIYDEYNQLVNIRRYKWDAEEGKRKMLNYEDQFGNTYGELRIFGLEDLLDDSIQEIVWCEGENDRIINIQNDIPSACPTSGAGAFMNKWLKYFRNKSRVYICMDNDEAGRIATKHLCEVFRSSGCEIFIIKWPEEMQDKEDITDWYVKYGKTGKDFRELMSKATKYEGNLTFKDKDAPENNVKEVHLADSSNAEYFNKRIKIPVLVSGKDTAPYICPKHATFTCGDKCEANSKKCSNCTLLQYAGQYDFEIEPTDSNIMKLIKCSEESQRQVLYKMAGINTNCKVADCTVTAHMNVEEVRLIPKTDNETVVAKEKEYVVRNGYVVDTPIKTNKRYTLYGSMYPEPTNQSTSYVFDKALPEKDIASDFEITDELKDQLKIFRPVEGQSVKDKLMEIHSDLERNVTKVWERKDVAIAVDLIYHTPLSFYFQDSFIKRGWGEVLIIGDSGQAKSTLVERLMRHYRLGEMLSGESSKRTGLTYNLQQTNKRWMLQWGALPLNDTGLVCIDELSGLSEDDMALMSDIRTSGVCKVNGVITSETNARTRVIYISNPRNGKKLETESYGVESVLKLWGKAEDVRRLDMAITVASGDVSPDLINRDISEIKSIPHKYTSELCNKNIMWIWSRRPDQIIFEPDAAKEILSIATTMGYAYSSKIPIVEAADQRLKLARLSAAVAAILFSTDEECINLVVKKEHVQFVYEYLTEIYQKPSFAYKEYSDIDKKNSDCSVARLRKIRQQFLKLPITDLNEFAKSIKELDYIDRGRLMDYTGLVQADIGEVMKFLTTNNLVEKCKSGYRRTPVGTAFIRSIVTKPVTREEKARAFKTKSNTPSPEYGGYENEM